MADQPFKVILFMVKDMLFSVVTAPEITSLADLRGKTIAITNLTASDDYAWRAAVRAQGVSPDDVTAVTSQTTANSFAALTSGAVQAAVLSPRSTSRPSARASATWPGRPTICSAPNRASSRPTSSFRSAPPTCAA